MKTGMKKKVLILIQGGEVAASRYRILQYITYLEDNGMMCTVMNFPGSLNEYMYLGAILPEYDCIFVQRKRFHFPFISILRKRARRIVYDLDDAVMFKNTLAESPYSKTRQKRFRNMVRNCDAVIAGNTFLRDQALRYNSAVSVIPTSIPVATYSLKDYSQRKSIVTIGWIGDHGSIHYLEKMKDVFEDLGRKYPGKVELKIICDVFFDCENMPVKKVAWTRDKEVDELKDIDIGIMPLVDDPWSWGKCGLKILQYFGVGVPAVCTPVGVNRDVVKPEHSGYWATTPEDWVKGLSMLVENPGLRQRMGMNGRMILEQGYTREANASRILTVLDVQ